MRAGSLGASSSGAEQLSHLWNELRPGVTEGLQGTLSPVSPPGPLGSQHSAGSGIPGTKLSSTSVLMILGGAKTARSPPPALLQLPPLAVTRTFGTGPSWYQLHCTRSC